MAGWRPIFRALRCSHLPHVHVWTSSYLTLAMTRTVPWTRSSNEDVVDSVLHFKSLHRRLVSVVEALREWQWITQHRLNISNSDNLKLATFLVTAYYGTWIFDMNWQEELEKEVVREREIEVYNSLTKIHRWCLTDIQRSRVCAVNASVGRRTVTLFHIWFGWKYHLLSASNWLEAQVVKPPAVPPFGLHGDTAWERI